jgi:methylmalonyl-CoA mutase
MLKAEGPSPLGAHASLREMPGIEDWRLMVERTLKGQGIGSLRSKTHDGIPIEPLYERSRDARPLEGRGAGPWVIVQNVDDPDPDRANQQALADLEGGATGLSLRFADASSAAGQGLPPTAEAVRTALDGVDLAAIHLRLEPHSEALQAAEWLKNLIATSGIAPERADIAFGLDPVAAMAARGAEPPLDPQRFAAAFLALRAAQFRGALATLDARIFHEAGATDAQELAAILGAAAWWLRALDDAGAAPHAALPYLGASVSVDRDVIVSIAKLRALRRLWARLRELCAVPKAALPVHAETSRRMLTHADPDTNLLRNTLAAFAAGTGGADTIAVAPHTAALGLTDKSARALARNLQHLLMEESQLHCVADPGAGSGAVEGLTEALAERAWAEFQTIEREGGIVESLRTGAFQGRVADTSGALVSEAAA